jgi:signal transduction histidine kinase
MADRGMILQVIYNLINNAINYTGDDKSVVVSQKCTETGVRISVADTGMGIEPEHLTEIWQRYYRLDKVHKRATVGTGLGLSIVKEALEAHGAFYGVESSVGNGSTFWFELPMTEISDIFDAKYDNSENKDL